MPNNIIFIVDAMFNELTHWLRIFGFHTVYMKDTSDEEILNKMKSFSSKGKRVILITGDKELFGRAITIGDAVFLKKQSIDNMLYKIFCITGLRPSIDKPLCSICNGRLRVVNKEEVKGKVPEKVYLNNDTFWVCEKCGHIYWRGTHWKAIEKTFKKVNEKLNEC